MIVRLQVPLSCVLLWMVLAVSDTADASSSSRYLKVLSTLAFEEDTSPYYYMSEVQKGIVYVAEKAGVRIVEINEDGEIETDTLVTPKAGGNVKRLTVKNDMMYVAQQLSLGIFDVSDPLRPTLMGRFRLRENDGVPTCVAAFRNHVYLFTGGKSPALIIIDATDPTKPFSTNKMVLKGRVVACTFHGNNLHAFAVNGWILTWDFTNPIAFNYKPEVFCEQPPHAVTAYKTNLYAAVDHDLRVYNVKDKDAPVRDVHRVNLGSPVHSLVWYRGHIFAGTEKGLAVVDATEPRRAYLKIVHPMDGPVTSVLMIHKHKLVLTDDSGMATLDAKEPKQRTKRPRILPSDVDDDESDSGGSDGSGSGSDSGSSSDEAAKRKARRRRRSAASDSDDSAASGSGSGSDDDDDDDEADARRKARRKQRRGRRTSPPPATKSRAHRDRGKKTRCEKGFALNAAGTPALLDSTVLAAGSAAWTTAPGSVYTQVPAWMDGAALSTAPHRMDDGVEVKATCCDDACDVFIFFEHCPPCSSATNGGLPGTLMSAGWLPSKCGPLFRVRAAPAAQHATVIFRKQLAEGDSETFFLTKEARFVGLAMAPAASLCHDSTAEAACTANSLCSWDTASSSCGASLPPCDDDTASIRSLRAHCQVCAAKEAEEMAEAA